MWGITWLVSMFGYPTFFLDADPATLALNPYLALLSYFIIIAGLFVTYQIHVKLLEKKLGKKLRISKVLNLYFPVKKSAKAKSGEKKE